MPSDFHDAVLVAADPDAETPAMAQVLRYYDLVDQGDVPGLIELFSPDATYCRPGYEPLVGHARLTAFYRDQRVIRGGKHTITTMVANASDVAVHGGFDGVTNDGDEVSLRFSDFFALSPDGRFSRRDTFFFTPLV
jgi:steroid delta-isomerase